MKGKRIRVIQSPLHTALWSGFGAYPTPLPIPETYNALQTGVVDCMDLTKSAYAGFRLYEVVPCLIETGHIWASGVIMVAAPFWKGLSSADKEALMTAATEGAAWFDAAMIADEEASMAQAERAGGKVFQVQDRAAWQDGARKVWADFAPRLGGLSKVEAVAAG
jgi:TRAP-type C4-dicarboxylate transport system substrate-binding protein